MACRQAVPQLLKKLQLAHGQLTVESTPRRLAVMVANVQARQEDVEERVRGPPAKVRCSRADVAQEAGCLHRGQPVLVWWRAFPEDVLSGLDYTGGNDNHESCYMCLVAVGVARCKASPSTVGLQCRPGNPAVPL